MKPESRRADPKPQAQAIPWNEERILFLFEERTVIPHTLAVLAYITMPCRNTPVMVWFYTALASTLGLVILLFKLYSS
ncbi:MAG: hypothetical protein K2Z81_03935 [Cyanobacteria bacterium]|nr:hypothetical protein [Cyanobacteriota bacterium]